jgi:hypothetical protein
VQKIMTSLRSSLLGTAISALIPCTQPLMATRVLGIRKGLGVGIICFTMILRRATFFCGRDGFLIIRFDWSN